jgi:acyl-CoA synthetase (AMP-forming)/AMP-acid ligase II
VSVAGESFPEGSVGGRLRTVFALAPEEQALLYGGRWFSWAEIWAGAEALIERCADLQPGSPVAVVCRNRPGIVAAIVGAFVLERPLWIANAMAPANSIATELREGRIEVAVADPEDWERDGLAKELKSSLPEALACWVDDGEPIVVTDLWTGGTPPEEPWRHEAAGVVIHTSGTTGPPKQIVLEAERFEATMVGTSRFAKAGDAEARLRSGVVPVSTPMAHIGGLIALLMAFLNGRRVALMDRFDPWEWAKIVEENQVATAGLVPTAMRMVVDAEVPPEALRSLRSVRSGTAPLSPELAEAFEERYGVPILSAYGATEFAGGVTSMSLDDRRRFGTAKRGSVGRAHPGVRLRVLGADGVELGPGESGMLEIAQGDGAWVKTSDIARIDEDGFLFLEGRADDAINRGGFKVDPREVEKALTALPEIRDAAVVGLSDRRLGAVPGALLVTDGGAEPDPEELRQKLRESLSPYKLPVVFKVVAEMPRTASLKVDRPAAVKALETVRGEEP